MRNRIRYLDIAKGISIICIVLGHLGDGTINRFVFTFHVPIFFIISGLFIKPEEDFYLHVKKRFRQLIIPYIFTSVTIIILSGIINELFYGGVETKKLMLSWFNASLYGSGDNYNNPIHIKMIGAIWFLLASFEADILLHFILKLKEKYHLLLVLLFFFLGYYTSRVFFWFPFSIQAGFCSIFYLYVGYLVSKYKNRYLDINKAGRIVFFIICLLMWIQFIVNYKSFIIAVGNFGRGFIDIVGSLCACYVVIQISKFIDLFLNNRITKLISYLGNITIIILCVHLIELTFVRYDIFISNTFGEVSYNTSLLIKIFAKLIIILPISIFVSKNKFLKILFGLKQ